MSEKTESEISQTTVRDLLQSAQEFFEHGSYDECRDAVRRAVDLLKSDRLKREGVPSSDDASAKNQYLADVFDCTQVLLVLLQHQDESHPSHHENLRLLASLCEQSGRLDEAKAIYALANQLSRKFGVTKRVIPEMDEGSIADQIITLCNIPTFDRLSNLTQSDEVDSQSESDNRPAFASRQSAEGSPEGSNLTSEEISIEAVAAGALEAILKDKLLRAPPGGKRHSGETRVFEQETLILMTAAISSFQSGDFEESVRCYKLILGQYDMLGQRLSDTALDCRLSLGAAYTALGDLANALSEYSHLAILLEEKLGTAHPYYIAHLKRLTKTCEKAGKLKEARAIIERASVLVERHLSEQDDLRVAVLKSRSDLLQADVSRSAYKDGGNEVAAVADGAAASVSESVQDILQSAETAFENGDVAACNDLIKKAFELLQSEAPDMVAPGGGAATAAGHGIGEKRRKQFQQDVFDCIQILLVLLQHQDEADANYQFGVRMLAGLNELSGKFEESKVLYVHANQLSRRFARGSSVPGKVSGALDSFVTTFSDLPAIDPASSLTQVDVQELFAENEKVVSSDAPPAHAVKEIAGETGAGSFAPAHIHNLVRTRRAQTLVEGTEAESAVADPGTRLLMDAANSAFQSGEFDEAVRCYKLIVPQLEHQGLRESEVAIDCRLCLGAAHLALGDLTGALSVYSHLAIILEKKLGCGHPFYLSNLHRLARTCERADKLSEADGIIRRAAQLAERSLGPDDELRLSIQDCEAEIKKRFEEISTANQIPAAGEQLSSKDATVAREKPAKSAGDSATGSSQTFAADPNFAELREAATGDRQRANLSINNLVTWIASCVLAIAVIVFWWPMLVQDSPSPDVPKAGHPGGSQVFQSADTTGAVELGPGSAILSVNDQPRIVPYIELDNSFSSILPLIANLQVSKTFWVERTPFGLRTDSGEFFFARDSAEYKVISEMRRIMEGMATRYNEQQSYPTRQEDWSMQKSTHFINPTNGKAEVALLKPYNRFTRIEDVFDGSKDVLGAVSFLRHGGGWFNEDRLPPLTISCGTICSNERRNGEFAADHFFMHATDRTGYLVAARDGDVLVGYLYKGIDHGNLSATIPPSSLRTLTAWPLPRAIMFVTDGPALWLGFIPMKYAVLIVLIVLLLLSAFLWVKFDFSKRVGNWSGRVTLLEAICVVLMLLVSMYVLRSSLTGL